MNPRLHVAALTRALDQLEPQFDRIVRWGAELEAVLSSGGRLLVAGNGGSAAHAQHLTSELVGRYIEERRPFSAIALHADTSALTAIANDYPPHELYARQVRAHGRSGDVLIAISTSGRSPNIVAAAREARAVGMRTWALAGQPQSPLVACVDEALCVDVESTATVQEVHQVVVHLICGAVDESVAHVRDLGSIAVPA